MLKWGHNNWQGKYESSTFLVYSRNKLMDKQKQQRLRRPTNYTRCFWALLGAGLNEMTTNTIFSLVFIFHFPVLSTTNGHIGWRKSWIIKWVNVKLGKWISRVLLNTQFVNYFSPFLSQVVHSEFTDSELQQISCGKTRSGEWTATVTVDSSFIMCVLHENCYLMKIFCVDDTSGTRPWHDRIGNWVDNFDDRFQYHLNFK